MKERIRMSEPDALEAFNRRLEALLAGDERPDAAPAENLPDVEQQALEMAARLAALNPSQESRLRYPLRRRLLAAPDAVSSSSGTWRSWRISALRLTPSLALLLVLTCVFVGTAAGLSASPTQAAVPGAEQTAALQPSVASAPARPGQLAPQLDPIPIPTPLAPPGSATLATLVQTKQQTPGRSTPPGIQNHQDAGSAAGKP
jgi:hypothetical protein